MKKTAALILALLLAFATGAQPASAATQLTSTDTTDLSIEWSNTLFPDGERPTAIIVRADNYADSLAAGALAGRLRAPVLMHPATNGLDADVAAELERLGVDAVNIIGGTAAVSQDVEDDLEALGLDVQRLADQNRISTAVSVMEDSTGISNAAELFLARAFGDDVDPTRAFADALAAGMSAGTRLAPLLLTETAQLSAETRSAIAARDSLETVYVVGGTAAISDAVVTELEGMGLIVQRVAGVDRAETAVQLANMSYNPNGSRLVTLVESSSPTSWVSGFAAPAMNGNAVLVASGAGLPASTAGMLQNIADNRNGGTLICAPEVDPQACADADAILQS